MISFRSNILILFLFFLTISVNGQNISVSSFKLLDNDLTANTTGTSYTDQNGQKAALIKIVTSKDNFSFDCGSLGIVKIEKKPSEIWLYVPRGVRRITISHPTLGVLRDYEFPLQIEGARTYEMVLTTDEIQTIVKHDIGGQYLIMNISPSTAIVKVDDVEVPIQEGVATKLLPYGKHTYSVSDPYYKEEQGIVEIGRNKQTIDVTLKPAYGILNISTTPENGAQVIIDNEMTPIGVTPVKTDKLKSGEHQLRLKLAQYETKDTTVNVSGNGLSENITVSMVPNFGTVHIVATDGSNIFINNQDKGKSPYNGRLTEGLYEIEARKASYRPSLISINISKGQHQNITLPATTPIYGVLNVNSRPVGANVYVDGKLLGTTPDVFNNILIGQRKIKITKDGYETYSKTINIPEDQTLNVSAILQNIRNKSKVTFSCNVDVDTLRIDGKLASMTGNSYLTPGIHNIAFTTKNGDKFTDKINVPRVGKHFNLIVKENKKDDYKNKDLYNAPVENKVWDVVEQMPSFPGGPSALMLYLAQNIKYPTMAEKDGVQGRVVVSFVVERDGSISDVNVVRSVDPNLDQEAVRVVKAMPKWIPGKQDGSAVRVKYNVPVSFRLQ